MIKDKQNQVYWSDCDRYVIINTLNKQGKYHDWVWVIRENELNDYTEWDYRDMVSVTDEQIRECEFPDGIDGFFIPDDLDF
jgi:hypothetical protein